MSPDVAKQCVKFCDYYFRCSNFCQLATAREKFALEDKQPARVRRMLKDPRAHSDNESILDDEGHESHLINPKGPRSKTATAFF